MSDVMSEWLKTIVLGVVEGLTEFLPVSSTGHLLVASNLLRFEGSAGVRLKSLSSSEPLCSAGFYARDLLVKHARCAHDPLTRRFWLSVTVASCAAVLDCCCAM